MLGQMRSALNMLASMFTLIAILKLANDGVHTLTVF